MSAGAPVSDLTGWRKTPFTGAGMTYDCYESGSGPGVVLVPEVPGVSTEVLGLAEHLVDSGFTVVIPSLFGQPGRTATVASGIRVIARLCVTAEFRAFATNAHRPITDYLRAIARDLAGRTPGRGVGVVGMCFTGGFALATAVEDVVLAPVMSQPSVPLPVGAARRRDPGLSAAELDRVVARTTEDGLCVLGLRFSADRIATAERLGVLRERLGAALEVIELDSAPGNAGGFGRSAHAVLTGEVREDPPNQAFAARERVVRFLHERIDPAEPAGA